MQYNAIKAVQSIVMNDCAFKNNKELLSRRKL